MSLFALLRNRGHVPLHFSFLSKVAQVEKISGSHTSRAWLNRSCLGRHSCPSLTTSDSRTFSFTPNMNIFARLTTLISKLAVTSPEPEKEVEVHEQKVNPKIESLQKEILQTNESFLNTYSANLDDIVESVQPPLKGLPKETLLSASKRKYKKSSMKWTKTPNRYPLTNMSSSKPTVTPYFKATRTFLQSLNVPVEELELYPDVQRMTEDEITMCIEQLKEHDIYNVFSLFLIQRILLQMNVGVSSTNKKILKNGKRSVAFLQQVRLYVSLCQLLEKRDLDIRHLLNQVAEIGQKEDLFTVHRKVLKLREIGASPSDILNNLELLRGEQGFSQKIKLYKNTRSDLTGPFPVALFLTKSTKNFKEQLALGKEVDVIAQLLAVNVEEFQACWGFKSFNTIELEYKIRMCLSAGISKKDIFNNLSTLNKTSVKKCHQVVSDFKETGLPASLFILPHMEKAARFNKRKNGGGSGIKDANSNNNNEVVDRRISQDVSRESGVEATRELVGSDQTLQEDWTGEIEVSENMEDLHALHITPTEGKPDFENSTHVASARSSERENKANNKKPRRKQKYTTMVSSKRRRKEIFKLIEHLLDLDRATVKAMYLSCISVEGTQVLDVTKNLEFLVNGPTGRGAKGYFTVEEIAHCPLLLAHPHQQLVRVVRDAENIVDAQLHSSISSTFSSLALSEPSISSLRAQPRSCSGMRERDQHFSLSSSHPTSACLSASLVKQLPQNSSFSSVSTLQNATPQQTSSFNQLTLQNSDVYVEEEICEQPSPLASACSPNISQNSHFYTEGRRMPGNRSVSVEDGNIVKMLFKNPVIHVNLLQYLLEKEGCFSMDTAEAHRHAGFLNSLH